MVLGKEAREVVEVKNRERMPLSYKYELSLQTNGVAVPE